jgi:hypothetical protein
MTLVCKRQNAILVTGDDAWRYGDCGGKVTGKSHLVNNTKTSIAL